MYLNAGPIWMKFKDGELRYLRVGEKELVRRVYFGVRDSRCDTVTPKFQKAKVCKETNGFHIELTAVCKNDIADYKWDGEISGTPDGRITFVVTGKPEMDFVTPRVGLNVLYGAESLAGQAYEVEDKGGRVVSGVFPREITGNLLSPDFMTLRYVTADGLRFSATLRGGSMGMEDQRNFGDSSFKAFGSLDHNYPNISKGDQQSQKLVLEILNVPEQQPAPSAVSVLVGGLVSRAIIPQLALTQKLPINMFANINNTRSHEAKDVTWSFNPALHMPDDDTLMENVSALVDQAHTIRSYAPEAKLHIDSIGFNSPYPRLDADPRNNTTFGAAWVTRAVKYLSLAGVEDAAFSMSGCYAPIALSLLQQCVGRSILTTEITAPLPEPVDAWAVQDVRGIVVFLINKMRRSQKVSIKGLAHTGECKTSRITAEARVTEGTVNAKNGEATVVLDPLEVCRLTVET